MRKKRRSILGLVIVLCAVAGLVFVFRGSLITVGLQWIIKRSVHEDLSYEEKSWKDGSLSLRGVKVGHLLSADQLDIDFVWKRPFSLETQVNLSHPKIVINPGQKKDGLAAFVIPSSFLAIKWKVDEGVFEVPYQGETRSLNFNFLSGEKKEEIGIWTLYDDEGVLLLSLNLSHADHQVQVLMEMPPVSLEKLPFLNSLSTSFHQNVDIGLRQSPGIEIVEDGSSIAEIQPPSSTTQSQELSRNSNVNILMKRCTSWEKATGTITLQGVLFLDKKGEISSLSTSLHAQSLALKNLTGDFSLEGESLQALLTYSAQANKSFWELLQIDVMLQKASLCLVKDLFRCEGISGQLGGVVGNADLKQLRCRNIELLNGYVQLPSKQIQGFIEKANFSGTFDQKESWKIASFECDLTQGTLSSQDWASSNLNGKITICDHAFQKSLLKGEFKGMPVEISLAGPLDEFEMTTEFLGDSKSWFELLMGESSDGISSFPIALKGLTKKHPQGYSFSGHLSAFEEEIKLGVELDPSGDVKEGWFCSQKCTEKIMQPFAPVAISGEISFCGTFDTEIINCFIQGSNLRCQTESLEISLPRLGLKNIEFLNTEGWAHVTYLFAEKQPKITFPFKEVAIKSQGFELENLQGNAAFEGDRLLLTHLAGKYKDIQMQLEAECVVSSGNVDLFVEGKWVEGKLETLLALSDIKTPATGWFVSGQTPFQITAKNILNKPEIDMQMAVFCENVKVPLTSHYQLDNLRFDLTFDSQEKKSKISHLAGDFAFENNQRYQVNAESIVYLTEGSPTYTFDVKLTEKEELLPILNLQGQGVQKSSSHTSFSLKGVFCGAVLDEVKFDVKDGKEVTSFSSTSRFQGKDLIRQLNFLQDIGVSSCDPVILDKVAMLEGEVAGKLFFSPNIGLLFEAEGNNLKIDQEDISTFELKGKKIADQWILEKMRVGDFNLKGSLLKAQEKWFCPYWEFKWKDVVAKGDASYDFDNLAIRISKLEGLLPASYNVRSDGYSHLFFSPDFVLKDLYLTAYKDGKKEGVFSAEHVAYNQHAWKADGVNLSVEGFNFPDPLTISWQDQAILVTNKDKYLTASFSKRGDCEEITGDFFGLTLHLHQEKTPSLFVGTIKIEDGSELAAFSPKHLFFLKDIQRVELKGLWQKKDEGVAFLGDVFGKDFSVKGCQIEEFHAKLDFNPTTILMKEIHLSDKSGVCSIRQLRCVQNQETLKWMVTAPLIRGKDIKPSFLRTRESPVAQEKPFCIRSLVFENFQGELGDLSSLTGHGSFNFTNAYKKEFSIFDAPLELVKNFGFDPALFTPISGQVICHLKNGTLRFSDLKNTYSEGHRSQFYLAPDPSYIDLTGNLNINLRLKQDVVLKLGEPFALNIHGGMGNLKYKIR